MNCFAKLGKIRNPAGGNACPTLPELYRFFTGFLFLIAKVQRMPSHAERTESD
jgi:hypothetical protein